MATNGETELELLADEVTDLSNVEDEGGEEAHFSGNFSISSYGADYTVDSLVKRMQTGAFFKPEFQRQFVWSQKQASRFVESLLMGLPVPGIFVYRTEGGKHLIIDGLQRLTTLENFYRGIIRSREFSLIDVRDPWNGKNYLSLDETDRLRLDDSVIHTTIFKQDFPEGGSKSVYEIFERINTGGLKLSPQEIRVCVNYSDNNETSFVSLLRTLNDIGEWRDIYGDKSARLKDEELILRFFALFEKWETYTRPLRGFLDDYMGKNREINEQRRQDLSELFQSTVRSVFAALGKRAFRPEKALNAAVFDAIMVGLATNAKGGRLIDAGEIAGRYEKLVTNDEFRKYYQRSTADEDSLKSRVRLAIAAFGA